VVPGWRHECQVPVGPGKVLTLWRFTTAAGWDGPAAAGVYTRRQDVGTDLRSLTVIPGLDRVTGRSVGMVGEEVVIGVRAYNLVNQVRRVTAERAGVSPRRRGFAGLWSVVRELLGQAARGMSWADLGARFDDLAVVYGRVRWPVRKPHRSFPRAVSPRRPKFPDRKRTAEPQGMRHWVAHPRAVREGVPGRRHAFASSAWTRRRLCPVSRAAARRMTGRVSSVSSPMTASSGGTRCTRPRGTPGDHLPAAA
jgi:hypothetical protein